MADEYARFPRQFNPTCRPGAPQADDRPRTRATTRTRTRTRPKRSRRRRRRSDAPRATSGPFRARPRPPPTPRRSCWPHGRPRPAPRPPPPIRPLPAGRPTAGRLPAVRPSQTAPPRRGGPRLPGERSPGACPSPAILQPPGCPRLDFPDPLPPSDFPPLESSFPAVARVLGAGHGAPLRFRPGAAGSDTPLKMFSPKEGHRRGDADGSIL